MRKLLQLEWTTVVLINLYQFANKSSDGNFLGVDKMIYFIFFGSYSLFLTIYLYHILKKELAKNVSTFNKTEKQNLLILIFIYFALAMLLLFFKPNFSNFYILNVIFAFVYFIKCILFLLYYRSQRKRGKQSNLPQTT